MRSCGGSCAPLFRLWFRMHVSGAEHIPAEGRRSLRPNHKSFWDSFFIGVCTRRHVRFMAKTELIEARYGRLLVRLGAFPVRRGQADEDALETARVILEQGGLLALFPEGTRIRDPDNLGHPTPRRRPAGAGDRRAARARARSPAPRRSSGAASPCPAASRWRSPSRSRWPSSPRRRRRPRTLIEEMVWPEVEGEYRRLRARPTVIAAGLAALGIGGGVLLRRKRRR